MKRKKCLVVAVLVAQVFLVHGTSYASGSNHPPIVIQSDADFVNCACVTSGMGTQANPYVIGPLAINSADGNAVYIDGSTLTKSFVLSNLTIAGNGAPTDQGIVLKHINPSGSQSIVAEVYGGQTSIQTANIGVMVENSNYVILDGAGANPNGPGITNSGAGTINKNKSGAIDVENSSHVTIRGWQMSTNGANNNPDYVAWDPGLAHWGVGGVRFFGVTSSVIDHNAAKNDTTVSFTVFHSSYNQITANTADYP